MADDRADANKKVVREHHDMLELGTVVLCLLGRLGHMCQADENNIEAREAPQILVAAA